MPRWSTRPRWPISCDRGRIGHYATDVFAKEPVPTDEPLLKLDNVTLTAHAGYNTPEAAATMYRRAIDLATAG